MHFVLTIALVLLAIAAGSFSVGRRTRRAASPRITKVVKWVSAAVFAILLPFVILWCAIATQTARYPYNSEGRYFDGVVVYHEEDPMAYLLLGFLWALPCAAAGAVWIGILTAAPRAAASSAQTPASQSAER